MYKHDNSAMPCAHTGMMWRLNLTPAASFHFLVINPFIIYSWTELSRNLTGFFLIYRILAERWQWVGLWFGLVEHKERCESSGEQCSNLFDFMWTCHKHIQWLERRSCWSHLSGILARSAIDYYCFHPKLNDSYTHNSPTKANILRSCFFSNP